MSAAATFGGIPNLQLSGQLSSQATAFAALAVGSSPSSLATLSSSSQGRPNFVVPMFRTTFLPPVPSHSLLVDDSHPTTSLPFHILGAFPLAQLSSVQVLSVVGPGFSAATAKLVNQMVAGKFV